jgi:hypothetical protein
MQTNFNARDRVQTADGRSGIVLFINYKKGQPDSATVQVNPTIIQHAHKGRRRAGEVTVGGQLVTFPLADLTPVPDDGATFFEPAGLLGSE